MSDASFLYSVCDLSMSYIGCSNYQSFALFDRYFMIPNVFSIVIFLVYVPYRYGIERYVRHKTFVWNGPDTLGVLAGLVSLLYVVWLNNNQRLVKMSVNDITLSQVQQYISINIWVEQIRILIGGVILSTFTGMIVNTASAGSLYTPIKIGETRVDPEKIVKGIRVFVFIMSITFSALWSSIGLSASLNEYKLRRRYYYLFTSSIALFISLPILYYFSGLAKVIATLRDKSLHSSEGKAKAKPTSELSSVHKENTGSPLSPSMPKESVTGTTGGHGKQTSQVSSTSKKPLDAVAARNAKIFILRLGIFGIMSMYFTIGLEK